MCHGHAELCEMRGLDELTPEALSAIRRTTLEDRIGIVNLHLSLFLNFLPGKKAEVSDLDTKIIHMSVEPSQK